MNLSECMTKFWLSISLVGTGGCMAFKVQQWMWIWIHFGNEENQINFEEMLKISWFFLTNYIGPLLMHISNYVDSNQIQIITWKPLPFDSNLLREPKKKCRTKKAACTSCSHIDHVRGKGFQLANYISKWWLTEIYVASPLNSRIICSVTTVCTFHYRYGISFTRHLILSLRCALCVPF